MKGLGTGIKEFKNASKEEEKENFKNLDEEEKVDKKNILEKPLLKNDSLLKKLEEGKKEKKVPQKKEKKENEFKEIVKNIFPEITDFSYKKYVESIWRRESSWNYYVVNSIWALWKYQFMPNTLKDYKDIICWKWNNCNIKRRFLYNPLIQEKVMAAYTLDHIRAIKEQVPSINSTDELIRYLAKAHLWWVKNIKTSNRIDPLWTSQLAYEDDISRYYNSMA